MLFNPLRVRDIFHSSAFCLIDCQFLVGRACNISAASSVGYMDRKSAISSVDHSFPPPPRLIWAMSVSQPCIFQCISIIHQEGATRLKMTSETKAPIKRSRFSKGKRSHCWTILGMSVCISYNIAVSSSSSSDFPCNSSSNSAFFVSSPAYCLTRSSIREAGSGWARSERVNSSLIRFIFRAASLMLFRMRASLSSWAARFLSIVSSQS